MFVYSEVSYAYCIVAVQKKIKIYTALAKKLSVGLSYCKAMNSVKKSWMYAKNYGKG